jgi:hypothetical protein
VAPIEDRGPPDGVDGVNVIHPGRDLIGGGTRIEGGGLLELHLQDLARPERIGDGAEHRRSHALCSDPDNGLEMVSEAT